MTLDDAHGWRHPITLVDMAGELFCTIVWRDNHSERLVTDKHQEALAEFEKILVDEKSEHQKLHVFIIEYGAEDKRYEGFDQDTYLECGLQFLEEKNVLRDATQAMYVLVTKTDQVKYHLVLLASIKRGYKPFVSYTIVAKIVIKFLFFKKSTVFLNRKGLSFFFVILAEKWQSKLWFLNLQWNYP